MPVKIDGLPAHVLLIHAVVVLIPLAAIMLSLGAVWPAARRRFGFLSPAIALVALVLVPITTHAGEWLEHRLDPRGQNKAIEKHANLGDTLLPWAIGIFVMAVVVWWLGRRYEVGWRPSRTQAEPGSAGPSAGATATLTRPATTTRTLPVWVSAVVAVVSIAVAVGGLIQLIRIGDSGAQAAWGYVNQLPPGR